MSVRVVDTPGLSSRAAGRLHGGASGHEFGASLTVPGTTELLSPAPRALASKKGFLCCLGAYEGPRVLRSSEGEAAAHPLTPSPLTLFSCSFNMGKFPEILSPLFPHGTPVSPLALTSFIRSFAHSAVSSVTKPRLTSLISSLDLAGGDGAQLGEGRAAPRQVRGKWELAEGGILESPWGGKTGEGGLL